MASGDIAEELQCRVTEAGAEGRVLELLGGGSKRFYGCEPRGEQLALTAHSGIVSYEPTELTITARGGTPLREIEAALLAANQMLPFEPPHFDETATLGGTIACNLSGPRRPYAGAARDLVLGCKLLNGKGEILSFGGEVMKNVAGYDLSRLMAGALGTLGILLEVSLKVLPRPEDEVTLRFDGLSTKQALARIHQLSQQPLPISASAIDDDGLVIRLSGTPEGVAAACHAVEGEWLNPAVADGWWQALREQQHDFFNSEQPLWRLSIGSDTPPLDIEGEWLYEWGGAQRWLLSSARAETIFDAAAKAGGHATAYRNHTDHSAPFQPLPTAVMALHRRLKQSFDPHGILNPGRLYAEL
ncbi:glycolate oxidase subunit GlcE [Solemya pervernicosa gill symbiont]|uniref:Glycolate oxidase subunit GlcE n=2 Tax=Gammaproteobacteria incertae sedis TaxID=118884 RepID=A0A1T2L5V7_9GAMM|nr:glycolate oxidase subunit GlcE [Candidatus Reidiella endopervernicosa]OOZ40434.1 glycolate oxidase subunit GlcE [Solemya pervernicosa gill symbiont]QKQ25347.1 glycolate oxidase subunit GlcE [Candidatus Reidiella endopervernicosa]